MTESRRTPKGRRPVHCGSCPQVIKCGDKGLEPVFGLCPTCRGRRGAEAARRIYQIHGHGFGRVAGRTKT